MRRPALAGLTCVLLALGATPPPTVTNLDFSGTFTRSIPLTAGKAIEISVGLPAPSKLPPNGRIAVEFAGYRKVLHALDPDFYIVYKAPPADKGTPGPAELKVTPVEDEAPLFNLPRWREPGTIQKVEAFPTHTPWNNAHVPLRVDIHPVDYGTSHRGTIVEMEPNDSLAQAQPITLADNVLANYREYLDLLDRELESIKTSQQAFREHPLAKNLYQEVSVQRSLSVNEAGKHAKTRFTRARDQIRDLLRQADTILFEVENGEKNRLEEELLREQEVATDVAIAGKIRKRTDVPAGMLYWPFEGEFWRDELGSYEYQIRSDCRRPR